MTANVLRSSLPVAALVALLAGVGCATDPDSPATTEEGRVQVETQQRVDPDMKRIDDLGSSGGVVTTSSSGGSSSGGGSSTSSSGGTIDKRPFDDIRGDLGFDMVRDDPPPITCIEPCWSPYEGADHCNCPGGHDYESSVSCPADKPVARFLLGVWRCYSR